MTKGIGFFVLVIALFLLVGCLNNNQDDAIKDNITRIPLCEHGNIEGCNRSCNSNLDCQEVCGAGCININEHFDDKGIDYSCPPLWCHCVNGTCMEYIED